MKNPFKQIYNYFGIILHTTEKAIEYPPIAINIFAIIIFNVILGHILRTYYGIFPTFDFLNIIFAILLMPAYYIMKLNPKRRENLAKIFSDE